MAKVTSKPRLPFFHTVRLSPEQQRDLRAAALAKGVSMGRFVREALDAAGVPCRHSTELMP